MRQIYKTVMAIGMMALPFAVSAQVSVLGNNGLSSDYVGWNAAQTFPLQIRHNGNQPIDFITDNTHRLRIMPSGTTTVNNYLIDHDGFVGMSTNPNFFNLVEPFSLLHLNGQGNGSAGPQQFGYRPWMREGIVFTQNSDLMYIGPMANAQDVTDAVITWSDNWGPGEVGPDVLRFLFTSNGNGTTVISPDPMNPNVLEIAIG